MMEWQCSAELLCIGGSSVDLLLRAPSLPAADEKLVVEFAGRVGGGLIANTACAASRLGLSTAWTGLLGSDEGGRMLMNDFARFDVDTSLAEVMRGEASDFCIILLTPNGERTILVVNTLPSPPPLSEAVIAALACTPLVYTMPYALDWFVDLAKRVHEGGGEVAVDIESAANLEGDDLRAALRHADLVFCSQGGLRRAAGTDDPQEGARAIQALGPKEVVVTLGSKGSFAITPDGEQFVPAYNVTVFDSTGAGDCFHAAYLVASREGRSLGARLRFASAAAALSVQAIGARGGLPNRASVERFLHEQEKPAVTG